MKKKISKKTLSTYDEYVESLSSEQLQEFEQGLQEEILSELMYAMMKQDTISVRKLAKAAGVSPTIIQEIKTGKKTNITLLTASRIANSLKHRIAFIPMEETTRNS